MGKHVSELQHAIDSLNSADDDYDRLLEKHNKLQEAARKLCPKVGYHTNDSHWRRYRELHSLIWDAATVSDRQD